MRLALSSLESRLTPSPMDLGGGVARLRDLPLFDVVAFPDFTGPLNVAEGVDPATGKPEVFVGAGSSGGPRVAVFDAATCVRLSDRFVGDPASRGGAIPFPVSQPAEKLIDVPSLAAGSPSDFTVYVGFDRPPSEAFVRDTFAAIAPYYAGLPIAFTTDRPTANPLTYATVVIGADPTWAGAAAAGEAPIGGYLSGVPAEVKAGLSAPLTAAVAAHELGHLFGLQHSADSLDLMYAEAGLNRSLSAAEKADVLHTITG